MEFTDYVMHTLDRIVKREKEQEMAEALDEMLCEFDKNPEQWQIFLVTDNDKDGSKGLETVKKMYRALRDALSPGPEEDMPEEETPLCLEYDYDCEKCPGAPGASYCGDIVDLEEDDF